MKQRRNVSILLMQGALICGLCLFLGIGYAQTQVPSKSYTAQLQGRKAIGYQNSGYGRGYRRLDLKKAQAKITVTPFKGSVLSHENKVTLTLSQPYKTKPCLTTPDNTLMFQADFAVPKDLSSYRGKQFQKKAFDTFYFNHDPRHPYYHQLKETVAASFAITPQGTLDSIKLNVRHQKPLPYLIQHLTPFNHGLPKTVTDVTLTHLTSALQTR